MGSSHLACPMCCGETFNNSQSLKYHLLSMTDNLYCPVCSQRSDSVDALIQHLDKCGQELKSNENLFKVEDSEVLMDTGVEEIADGFFTTVENDGIMIVNGARTIEVDEHGSIKVLTVDDENSKSDDPLGSNLNLEKVGEESTPVINIPDSALGDAEDNDMMSILPDESAEFFEPDESFIEIKQDLDMDDEELRKVKQDLCEVNEDEVDSSAVYNCSSCSMSFNSVLEHIKQYHDGQEVVLEMADELPEPSEEPKRPKPSMNTLRTEECVDSEGRVYTRKVVQIERFWDKRTKPSSMIEKFFSTDPKPRTQPSQRQYRCSQCLEEFTRLPEFRTHVCVHGSNQCESCDSAFATPKALATHMKTHETDESARKFMCTTCGTQFSSHKSLRLHSRMHAPVRARHVDAPEGKANATFTCAECGKVLSEFYREAHMSLHAGDSVTCAVCNRKFDSADSLAMHAAVHPELGVNQYPNCPAADIDGTTTDSPNGDVLKPYQCQHCGRRFTRPHEKVKHERIHTGEKPHACEVCGKRFRVSYCLTLHMRTHTGVRPYQCQHCGKRFKASSVYNHHLLTHGDARAYKCGTCPKTFKTRVQLAGHKNSHTKPFRCTECSRPFASLYAARAHIETHKKDNNLKFSCNICGASYGRAFALKDHIKAHANTAPEPAREVEVAENLFLEAEVEEVEEEEDIETVIVEGQLC